MEPVEIMIVGSEEARASALRRDLSNHGFIVDIAEDEKTLWQLLELKQYAACLVDVDSPRVNELHLLKNIRARGYAGGVILVSASTGDQNKIDGFHWGADDYLAKPFEVSELAIRLKALIRRIELSGAVIGFNVLRVGDLLIDFSKHLVEREDRVLRLTRTEFDLLTHFMRKPDHIFSTQAIAELLFEEPEKISTNTIAVHIKNLRFKVDGPFERPCIRTERGFGYGINSAVLLQKKGGTASVDRAEDPRPVKNL
jgi:DNA-binding response OmpR family regulator